MKINFLCLIVGLACLCGCSSQTINNGIWEGGYIEPGLGMEYSIDILLKTFPDGTYSLKSEKLSINYTERYSVIKKNYIKLNGGKGYLRNGYAKLEDNAISLYFDNSVFFTILYPLKK